ncbi:hypothetical protein ACFL3A_04485 [Pseudomonadota bacterium]
MTKNLAGLMLTLICMLNASGARAVLQTYSFDVTATDGPLSGVTTIGTFSFSDAIIPSGGGTVGQLNLFVGLDFTWNGISYDQTMANTGLLSFDAAGNLTEAVFGTDCFAGGCNLSFPENAWVFIYPNGLPWNFAYKTAATTGDDAFFGVSTGFAAVPLPATVWLFSSGLLGLIGLSRGNKAAKSAI